MFQPPFRRELLQILIDIGLTRLCTYERIVEDALDKRKKWYRQTKKFIQNNKYKRVGTHDMPLSPEEVIELAKAIGKDRAIKYVLDD